MKNGVEQLIRKYLKEGRMLQIATVDGGQPWSCTVYYASDDDLNLYWISKPASRHSREIAQHAKVAGSIPIKFDDLNVIGISLEGEAKLAENVSKVKLYSDKFKRGEAWHSDFLAGKNEHKLYMIKPKRFVLFDRVNFPDNERQEWKPDEN